MPRSTRFHVDIVSHRRELFLIAFQTTRFSFASFFFFFFLFLKALFYFGNIFEIIFLFLLGGGGRENAKNWDRLFGVVDCGVNELFVHSLFICDNSICE